MRIWSILLSVTSRDALNESEGFQRFLVFQSLLNHHEQVTNSTSILPTFSEKHPLFQLMNVYSVYSMARKKNGNVWFEIGRTVSSIAPWKIPPAMMILPLSVHSFLDFPNKNNKKSQGVPIICPLNKLLTFDREKSHPGGLNAKVST